MNYKGATDYLESFINYEKLPAWPYKESLKLERFRDFLSLIDDPQSSLKCIHVAGSKGKGSTCAFIAHILREAGYKTGLYTSPHLSDFRERVRILKPGVKFKAASEDFEGMISRLEITGLIQRLKPKIEKFNKASPFGPLSFFEVYTALAFLYFKEKKTDLVVLETGLGGRLDATNTADSLVAVITPISYEHTQKLGNTLKQIAGEKAGIIKKRSELSMVYEPCVVVSAPQAREAGEVIRKKCKLNGLALYEVGREIRYKETKSGFEVKGIFARYSGLKIKLLGKHQLMNAATAVAAVEALRGFGISVKAAAIKRGLIQAFWPGRCEVVLRNPYLVLDGAQNSASSGVLKEAIQKNFKYRELILVLGVSKDKDIKGISEQLKDLTEAVILTKADNPRAIDPADLAGYFPGKNILLTNSVKEALQKARQIAKRQDLILVTGSLFVVGESRELSRGK